MVLDFQIIAFELVNYPYYYERILVVGSQRTNKHLSQN